MRIDAAGITDAPFPSHSMPAISRISSVANGKLFYLADGKTLHAYDIAEREDTTISKRSRTMR
jgi:hypothetical protein